MFKKITAIVLCCLSINLSYSMINSIKNINKLKHIKSSNERKRYKFFRRWAHWAVFSHSLSKTFNVEFRDIEKIYANKSKNCKDLSRYLSYSIYLSELSDVKKFDNIYNAITSGNQNVAFKRFNYFNKDDLNLKDKDGCTLLIKYIKTQGRANLKFIKKLIKIGRPTYWTRYIDLQDNEGKTALHYACIKQNLELVQELIKRGANQDIQDKYRFTPIKYLNIKLFNEFI